MSMGNAKQIALVILGLEPWAQKVGPAVSRRLWKVLIMPLRNVQ
jgi:hypothetical protein